MGLVVITELTIVVLRLPCEYIVIKVSIRHESTIMVRINTNANILAAVLHELSFQMNNIADPL